MGIELIIVAVAAGVVALTSAGVSIGTVLHFKKKSKSKDTEESHDTTSIKVKNIALNITNKDGSTFSLKEQEINVTNMDKQTHDQLLTASTSSTETGRKNEVAEKLASGGVGVLGAFASPTQTAHILAEGVASVATTLAANNGTAQNTQKMPPIQEELEEKQEKPIRKKLKEKQVQPVREEHEQKYPEKEDPQFLSHKTQLDSQRFINAESDSDSDVPDISFIDPSEESNEETALPPADLAQDHEQLSAQEDVALTGYSAFNLTG